MNHSLENGSQNPGIGLSPGPFQVEGQQSLQDLFVVEIVRPAVGGLSLGDTVLAGEEIALGVELDRGFVPDQPAQ